jgi:hypothetical protein
MERALPVSRPESDLNDDPPIIGSVSLIRDRIIGVLNQLNHLAIPVAAGKNGSLDVRRLLGDVRCACNETAVT